LKIIAWQQFKIKFNKCKPSGQKPSEVREKKIMAVFQAKSKIIILYFFPNKGDYILLLHSFFCQDKKKSDALKPLSFLLRLIFSASFPFLKNLFLLNFFLLLFSFSFFYNKQQTK
jgi:hypothetical protein